MDVVDDDFAGTERFQVLRRLGKGGMGVVYEVLDREHGERVALKTLKRMTANAVLRFKNEFRALQDLHHPNLVRLGELFEQGGRWFFTMELINGVSLLDYVRIDQAPPPGPSLSSDDGEMPTLPEDGVPSTPSKKEARRGYDEEKLRSALAQLASALYALHQTHQVHRDIKPSNILVTPDGQVKLLDFGLVTEAADKRIWADDHLVGTVSYMAPEQAAQKPVGPAADWYSVGVLLYQALTGVLPVRGTTQDVLVLKQALEPVPPNQVAPVPPDLDLLCQDLLRVDPTKRPDGAEVLQRLSATVYESGTVSADVFIGRRREFAELEEAFAATRAGQRVVVLMVGESGVGKSAIAHRFARRVRGEHTGAATLLGRCYERESVPYKAIDGVIDSLSRYMTTLPTTSVAKYLPEHAGLLGKVFPVLRRVEGFARATRPPDNLDPVVLRARLFTAFRELWQKVARGVPLVAVIDDLQWADEDSLTLLEETLREPDAPPFLLVATVRARSTEEAGYRRLLEVTRRAGGDVRTMHVKTLPPEDANALVRSLVEGTSIDTANDASLIAEAAGGHPLFIDELVRQRKRHSKPSAPLRLDDALYARTTTLEPDQRRLLSIVALAGIPITQETAARAAEMEFGALARIATPLRAQKLVRTNGVRRSDLIEPYHDRVREAVVERLGAAERTGLHGRLALALEAEGDADPEALAVHFEGAGDTERAAEYTERAADDAAQKLAFDRAARLYQRSKELRPRHGAEASAIQTKLGHALANAGRGADAARAYIAAIPDAAPGSVLVLRRHVAEQFLRCGLFDEGVEQLGLVLAGIGMTIPKTPPRALVSLLFRRMQVRLRGIGFRERAASEISPEALEHADVCWSAAVALGMVDNIRGAYFQARGFLLALQAGEPYRVARALAVEAIFAATAGGDGRERAEMLLAAAATWAQKVGDPFVLAWSALADAIAAYVMGEFARSHESSVRARRLLDGCTGVAWERETADFYSVLSAFYLGNIKDQAQRVERGRREADERGDLIASTYVRSGLAIMSQLARDDVQDARREIDDTMRRWSRRGYFFAHFWCCLGSVQTDLYAGDAQRAFERITAEWPQLESSLLLRSVQIVRIEALHMRARAALAVAQAYPDRRDAMMRLAVKDARKMERENMAYATPLARLVRAGEAALRGDDAAATSLLDEAASGFDAADMRLYAAAARHRRGLLTGDGAAVSAAEEILSAEDIRVPERVLRMLAPGFRAPDGLDQAGDVR